MCKGLCGAICWETKLGRFHLGWGRGVGGAVAGAGASLVRGVERHLRRREVGGRRRAAHGVAARRHGAARHRVARRLLARHAAAAARAPPRAARTTRAAGDAATTPVLRARPPFSLRPAPGRRRARPGARGGASPQPVARPALAALAALPTAGRGAPQGAESSEERREPLPLLWLESSRLSSYRLSFDPPTRDERRSSLSRERPPLPELGLRLPVPGLRPPTSPPQLPRLLRLAALDDAADLQEERAGTTLWDRQSVRDELPGTNCSTPKEPFGAASSPAPDLGHAVCHVRGINSHQTHRDSLRTRLDRVRPSILAHSEVGRFGSEGILTSTLWVQLSRGALYATLLLYYTTLQQAAVNRGPMTRIPIAPTGS